jgi:hypothetical protein
MLLIFLDMKPNIAMEQPVVARKSKVKMVWKKGLKQCSNQLSRIASQTCCLVDTNRAVLPVKSCTVEAMFAEQSQLDAKCCSTFQMDKPRCSEDVG